LTRYLTPIPRSNRLTIRLTHPAAEPLSRIRLRSISTDTAPSTVHTSPLARDSSPSLLNGFGISIESEPY